MLNSEQVFTNLRMWYLILKFTNLNGHFNRNDYMSYLSVISQLLFYGFVIGACFWLMRFSSSAYMFSRRKVEINKLDARISVLKMHLRAKIKSKYNKIEILLKNEAETLTALKPMLDNIISLSFNSPSDYQLLITNLHEITVKINEYIRFKHKNLVRDNQDKPEARQSRSKEEEAKEHCTQLVKYDRANMIIILQIVESTNELRSKILQYNELAKLKIGHKKIRFTPDVLEIEHYNLIKSLIQTASTTPEESSEFPNLENKLLNDAA
jgi:hypothetical protein